jgi:hypothetical protein
MRNLGIFLIHLIYENYKNGKQHNRKRLVYSKDLDRVFYFCCKLFNSKPNKMQLANE